MGRPIRKQWFGLPVTVGSGHIKVDGVKFSDGTTAVNAYILRQVGDNSYIVRDAANTHAAEIVTLTNATSLGALSNGQCYILATPAGSLPLPCKQIQQFQLSVFNNDGTFGEYNWVPGNSAGSLRSAVLVPSVTPTLRQVATNARMPDNFATASKQIMTRSRHYARSKITSMQLVFANWYVDPATWAETNPGAVSTITCGLEVNNVNVGSFTVSGNPTITAADGATVLTDALPCNINAGDVFYLRTYMTNATGVIFQGSTVTATRPPYNDTTNGESCRIGASGIVDQSTGTGLLTGGSNYTGAMYTPVAVLGMSADPAIYCLGDSEVVGIGDAYVGTSGDRGVFARSIGPYYAYSTIAVGGDSATRFVASHTKRVALAQYFTHVACNYGVNDITNQSRTAAQTAADLTTITGYFTGKPFFVGTLSPYSASTDNWTTTVNQTPNAFASTLNTFNGLVRAGITGTTGYFEISDVLSTARNSNIWLADGVTPRLYTADGLHGTTTANQLVQTSNAVNSAVFVPY